jgi:uridine phosphorylase
LGTHTGGGTYTYGNTSAADYGVNNDGTGNLSGFAWSTNAGWINFNPTHGGVTVDPASGSFDGYAWAENVGWIHFTRPDVYNVVVVEGAGDIYLPIIFKGYVPPVPPPAAPDLVVDDLVATSTAVTVTIRNAGTTAVNDEFWVDVYFDPSQTPSLNHPWDTIADHGVVWGVTTAIPVGGSLVLTTDASDPYYVPEYSSTPPLPVGAEVWALVDSVDYSTTYGAVQESDEGNNLYGPVTSTAATGEAAPVFKQSQPASREGLPTR